MTNKTNDRMYHLEVQRAHWIVEKAIREQTNVVDTLVSHMVSPSIILEVTGKTVERTKRVKQTSMATRLREWVQENLDTQVNRYTVAEALGVSESTAYKIIKENSDYFTQLKRGVYVVKDGVAERAQAKK